MRYRKVLVNTIVKTGILFFPFLCISVCSAQTPVQTLQESGIRGGLIVHLGCGDGKRTVEFYANDRYLVHGLDTDPGDVSRARQQIAAIRLYGKVSVDTFDGIHLPYIDNLVNLLVAEDLGNVSMDEVMRVLCPGGVACIRHEGKWSRTVKAWPSEIDEWTHYMHGPDNNAVAKSAVERWPKMDTLSREDVEHECHGIGRRTDFLRHGRRPKRLSSASARVETHCTRCLQRCDSLET